MKSPEESTHSDGLFYLENKMDNRLVKIYALIDPVSKECRYVGKTVRSIRSRVTSHKQSRHKQKSIKTLWLESLNYQPDIVQLDEVEQADWQESEQAWIAYLKYIGCRLTNITIGGDNGCFPMPQEVKDRIGASNKGNKHSLESRRKMSEYHTGLPMSDKTKTKLSQINKGKIVPEDVRKKISEGLKGRVFSEQHRQNLSKAGMGNKRRMGKPISELQRSAINKTGFKHSEKSKIKMSESAVIKYRRTKNENTKYA